MRFAPVVLPARDLGPEERAKKKRIAFGKAWKRRKDEWMPRPLKLSPLQRNIVMMLEEAGGEMVGTVMATLKASHRREFAAQVRLLNKLAWPARCPWVIRQ